MAPEHRSDPQGEAVPDPTEIRTPADLARALATIKGTRSYRALTAAADDLTPGVARQTTAVDDWTPEALTRGTVSDWMSGRGVPTRPKLLTFLAVCDIPASQVPGWLAALDRVRSGKETEDVPTAESDPRPLVRRPLFAPLVAVVVIAVVVGAVLLARAVLGAGDDSRATAPTPTARPAAACAEQETGPARVLPRVTIDGSQLGMDFCPVVINGGRLPITGPFELAGQVLGPIGERQQVVLINYGDPRTCDALGNRPPQGGFLLGQVIVGSADGQWSYVDKLGYDEAVTISRQYEYVTASQESLVTIKGDAATWIAANPGRGGDYPGILALPADAKVLARFDVPAGVYKGARACQ